MIEMTAIASRDLRSVEFTASLRFRFFADLYASAPTMMIGPATRRAPGRVVPAAKVRTPMMMARVEPRCFFTSMSPGIGCDVRRREIPATRLAPARDAFYTAFVWGNGCLMRPNVRHERRTKGREAAFGLSARWRG